MNLIRAIVKMFGARVVASVIAFIGLAYFARELGASQVGVLFLFQGATIILMWPANVGLRGALEKRVSSSDDSPAYLTATVLLKLVPLLLLASVIFSLEPRINAYIGAEVGRLLIISLFFQEAYKFSSQLLRAELRVDRSADLLLIRQSVWVVGGAASIEIWGGGVIGVIYAWILGAIVASGCGLLLKSTAFGHPHVQHLRSLLSYAKFDAVSGVGSMLFSWLDVIIIGLLLTQAEVGAYETAWRLSAVTILIGAAIRESIFPQISVWNSDDDSSQISDTVQEMITASLFFVIPSFVGTLVLSRQLLGLIFGPEFVMSSVVLVILTGQKLFQAVDQIVGRTLQAMNFPNLAAYGMTAGILLNIILNLVLITAYGIEGAAIATFASYVVMTLFRLFFLKNNLQFTFDWRTIGWCVVSAGVMGIVISGLERMYEINTLLQLSILIAIGVVVYLAVVFTSVSVRSQFRTHATKALQ